jgi:hypothetical protein
LKWTPRKNPRIANEATVKIRILIGICSCHRFTERRKAVRETWLGQLPDGIAAVFFVGEGDLMEPDAIVLPVRDDYSSLPKKTQAFCRYALEHYEFDYLFKCDDDTYVIAEHLFDLLTSAPEFVGSNVWWPSHADGGAGYLLCQKAVRIIAQALCPETGPEDVWVTQTLQKAGMSLSASERLLQRHRNFPKIDDNVITVHWCTPEMLRETHKYTAPNLKIMKLLS